MTASTAPTGSDLAHGRPPWPVVVSFYLWWIPILLQAVLLAYIGLSLAEAARVGGPAWDILFVDAVPALVVLTATTAEIVCVFLMRAGRRGVRISLLAVGLIMLALTTWQVPSLTSLTDPDPVLVVGLLLFVLGTIGAIIAMFTPPASAFLRRRPARDETPPPADPPDR